MSSLLLGWLACGVRSHPGAPEVEDAGPDAGGAIDAAGCEDDDGDGHSALSCGGDDCDDGASTVHPGTPDEDWVVDVVDPGPETGRHVSVAVDGEGAAHIAHVGPGYVDGYEVPRGVQYATNASGRWVTEAASGPGGTCVSLGLDARGAAHVAHCWSPGGFEGGAVSYATNEGADWISLALGASGRGGTGGASLVVDADDAPHVVFSIVGGLIGDPRDLLHATNARGAWTFETVNDSGGMPSVGADLDGALHIAYARSRELWYATNRSGAWLTEVVGDTVSGWPSLALDTDGGVQVVYPRRLVVGDDGAELRHVSNASGPWTFETVDEDASVHASLEVDAEGIAHVGYSAPDGLHYATDGSGAWISELVADPPSTFTSLALGADAIHIGFESSGRLLHARRPFPNGIDDDCDGLAW